MKKASWLAVVVIMAPVVALAQSKWSVSPAVGFYKAKLDAVNEDLSRLRTLGVTVEKPNGSLHFGGRLHYQKTAQWSWLAETSLWKDKAAGNLRGANGTSSFEDQIRLVPIMVGSQYYFGQPKARNRVYAGATGGIVLVNVKSQFNLSAAGAAPLSQTSSLSGTDFVSKPFVGLEIVNTRNMSFWGEVGYMLGKYTLEITDLATGAKTEKDVSISGLHVTGGVRFAL
jgi:hypothetical protein